MKECKRRSKQIEKLDTATILIIALTLIIVFLVVNLFVSSGFKIFLLNQVEHEQLEIDSRDVKICCTFIDSERENKSCNVFTNYDCDLCVEKCFG